MKSRFLFLLMSIICISLIAESEFLNCYRGTKKVPCTNTHYNLLDFVLKNEKHFADIITTKGGMRFDYLNEYIILRVEFLKSYPFLQRQDPEAYLECLMRSELKSILHQKGPSYFEGKIVPMCEDYYRRYEQSQHIQHAKGLFDLSEDE